ncbi:MAG: type II toxin-antitoxin system prevent-host-death family antitoxin [Geodermatophilaceae bacterium]|nr:type II toxin-antitoxin system prevent-host-death family antitoxin [Geodermatophilaceae bacterium]MDQ3456419.1 type II toxin-antitoxin system prevent-host-death family antitoxin [Actinomycetota bacterium]
MSVKIAQRELRNDVAAILRRVAAGESFTVTVRGEPVAELVPIRAPRRFVPRRQVMEILQAAPPDPGLLDELRQMDFDDSPDR